MHQALPDFETFAPDLLFLRNTVGSLYFWHLKICVHGQSHVRIVGWNIDALLKIAAHFLGYHCIILQDELRFLLTSNITESSLAESRKLDKKAANHVLHTPAETEPADSDKTHERNVEKRAWGEKTQTPLHLEERLVFRHTPLKKQIVYFSFE